MNGLNIPAEISWAHEQTIDTGRLLRSLGTTGRLTGYNYMIYIVNSIIACPDEHRFLTKNIYPDAAKRYYVTPQSVEHAIRTLIRSC